VTFLCLSRFPSVLVLVLCPGVSSFLPDFGEVVLAGSIHGEKTQFENGSLEEKGGLLESFQCNETEI